MLNAVKSGFRRMGDVLGRSSRAEFWLFLLFVVLVRWGLGFIDEVIFPANARGLGREFSPFALLTYAPLSTLFGLITIMPILALIMRRLHDVGRSGWWGTGWLLYYMVFQLYTAVNLYDMRRPWSVNDPVLLMMLALLLVWLGALVVFFMRDSEPGDNRYGNNPRCHL